MSIFFWAFGNDYVLYEVYNASEVLESNSIISNQTLNSISNVGDDYSGLSGYFDWGYVLLYVTFFLSTILVSYYSREEDYFSFLNSLFWGTMFILFVISIVTTISDWWVSDILYNLIPNIESHLVKFDWIHTNIGILSFIQMLICIFANRMYFRIKDTINKISPEFEEEVV
jgi:hypothetical protein